MSIHKTEFERRFIVRGPPPVMAAPFRMIRQGYLSHTPMTSMRIRIASHFDGSILAQMGKKSGWGEARSEEEPEVVDLNLAEFLYRESAHRLEKTRFLHDGWEVDFFKPPLSGLVLAEFESDRPLGRITPPDWLEDAVDVTDTVNNALLAELATELRNGVLLDGSLAQLLTEKVTRIVLTGGPCSGKSSLCRLLKQSLPDLHTVPEVATIVMAQVGRPPRHELGRQRFNRDLTNVQMAFEGLADVHCKSEKRSKVVFDRGCVDNAAYDPDGVRGFELKTGLSVKYLYSRYDRVICLGTPPEAVFNAQRHNNPERRENYSEAVALGNRTYDVWSGHPNFYYLPNQGSWEETVNRVTELVAAV